jgi:uncharacterized protein DUF3592
MSRPSDFILPVGGYLWAAFFLFVGYFIRSKTRRFLASASVAKGTVISLERSRLYHPASKAVEPVFTFRDAQGVEHRVRSNTGRYPPAYRVGDLVDVFYHPNAPQEAMIDPKGEIQIARILIFLGVAAAIIITIIVIRNR